MADANDMDLVREFARHNSEMAFALLVQRHINLVYSVALRFTGNTGDAQDVTQAVFIIFARKAAGLPVRTVFTGWLYETTRYTAIRLLRTQARRRTHEQEATMQSTLTESGTDQLWHQLAPHLEDAMSRLAERDRTLLALRFYENKTGAQAAAQLGIREDAAHKRTARALERLRKFFTKRGIDSTTAVIAKQISAHSVQAAPVALAKTVTAVAIAKGAAASLSTLTLIKGALKIMAWTKMQTAIVVGVTAIVVITTTTVLVKEVNTRSTYYKGKPLIAWLKDLDDQNPGPANDQASDAVRHIGKNGLPTIISSLQMKNPLHHGAVVACQILGSDAKPAIPALVKLLTSGYTYGYVGAAFGQIGPDAVPTLVELTTNNNEQVRTEAVSSLGNMTVFSGNNDALRSNAIPALLDCLKDKSPFVRCLTARSLGQIGSNEATVVPALMASLDDPDFQTRWNVCLALGNFGTRAKIAIPSLQAALNDKNSSVRGTAAIALVQIESDDIVTLDSMMPILIENLNGSAGRGVNFRFPTAETLASWGDKAKAAVPALLNAVKNTSGYEQQEILNDLKKIDPEAAANAVQK